MFNPKKGKNAFTLAETLIVASLFAAMVLWIIFWINRAFAFMNNTRVLVRSTNFAREWVEMVYNLRDTNRRKCSGNRDKTRLYVWTGVSKCGDIGGNDLLKEWIYAIKEWTINNDTYIYADLLTGDSHYFESPELFFDENNKDNRTKSKISFPWTYSYYSGGKIATWNLEDLLGWSGIEFYRVLHVYGVYEKNTDEAFVEVSDMQNSDPKEMRFCVKVFYTYNWWHHASELCSIMTNFME